MKKILILLSFFTFPIFSQWKEFVSQFGNTIPYVMNNPERDLEVKKEFFRVALPAYNKFLLLILSELNCKNFKIEQFNQTDPTKQSLTWSANGIVSRGGLKATFFVDFGTPFQYSPKQFVNWFENEFEKTRINLILYPWLIKESPWKDQFQIISWRDMILYEKEKEKCEVILEVGSLCVFDLNTSIIVIKPLP